MDDTSYFILGIIAGLGLIIFVVTMIRSFYLLNIDDRLMDEIQKDCETLETLTGTAKADLDKVINEKMQKLLDFRMKHQFFL